MKGLWSARRNGIIEFFTLLRLNVSGSRECSLRWECIGSQGLASSFFGNFIVRMPRLSEQDTRGCDERRGEIQAGVLYRKRCWRAAEITTYVAMVVIHRLNDSSQQRTNEEENANEKESAT